MICNYTNTIDLCCNKYSYSFINVIPSGITVIADKSETSPVLRTDKSTLETKIISPSSNNLIPTCDINDDSEDTTDWECYIIYRYMCSGIISDPPLQTFKDAQIDLINTSYSSTLEEGILVTINSKNIILGSSINDQISYKSILSYAQALYDDDTDASMPPFTDKNGQVYNLSYSDLIVVFKTYFEKVILYKNLKDTLINQCSNSSTIDDIQQINWSKIKPITGSLIGTKIVTTVDKPIVQSCIVVDTDTSGVDVSCDPPCDPESCEICVDGSCVSSCGQGECCDNGLCGNCIYGECCVNGQCQETWFFDSSVSTTVNCQPPGYSSDGFDGTTYFWRLQSGPYPTSSAAASAPYGICDRQEFCNFLSVYCGINDCDINGSNYGDGTCTTDRVFECS